MSEASTRPSSGIENVGLTLKERMALLSNQSNNSTGDNELSLPNLFQLNGAGSLSVKKPFVPGNKPSVPGNKPSVPGNKPAVSPLKPKPLGTAGYNSNNTHAAKIPKIDMKIIENRKKSLKLVESKRGSSYPESGAEDSETSTNDTSKENSIITTEDGTRFKKLSFIKKFGKLSKPDSLTDIVLPSVQYMDTATGTEVRLGSGRKTRDSNPEFVIKSMTEEDEQETSLPAPALPKTPHPSLPSLPGRRNAPLPQPTQDSAEELYDEGEALADPPSADDDGQELYEEFDEVLPPRSHNTEQPPAPAVSPVAAVSSVAAVSPEDSKKLSKADKEKLKKEKKEQERIQKLRQNEVRDQEAFRKKYKITDEELVSSHFIEVVKAYTGSDKTMLPVQVKERVALIRKTGCPKGKWIAKNLNTHIFCFY